MSSQVIGAWQLVSDRREGLAIFTETHYTIIQMEKNRRRFEKDELTESEQAEAFRTFQAQGGTYTASESTLALHREMARDPDNVGQERVFQLTFQGDSAMKWSWISGRPGRYLELTWQKVIKI